MSLKACCHPGHHLMTCRPPRDLEAGSQGTPSGWCPFPSLQNPGESTAAVGAVGRWGLSERQGSCWCPPSPQVEPPRLAGEEGAGHHSLGALPYESPTHPVRVGMQPVMGRATQLGVTPKDTKQRRAKAKTTPKDRDKHCLNATC